MISKECFTEGWIESVSSEKNYPDKNLIEKYNSDQPIVKSEKYLPSAISKMLIGNPEAYFYWSKYAEIEDF